MAIETREEQAKLTPEQQAKAEAEHQHKLDQADELITIKDHKSMAFS